MTEEDALVAGIREHPLDDLRRLVYADWLDERGRSVEAEYLRLVAVLAAPCTPVDVEHPHAVRLVKLADQIGQRWREAVGSRFDLWLDWYEPRQKINVIRHVREVGACGLAEAKGYSESLPKVLPEVATFEEAAAALAHFQRLTARTRIVPTTSASASRLRLRNVMLHWESWVLDGQAMCSADQVREGLGHMRRILTADLELAERAAEVPESLEEGVIHFGLVIGIARTDRDLRAWRQRLFQHHSPHGPRADPPFYGHVLVKTAPS